jgi:hypothetical protein
MRSVLCTSYSLTNTRRQWGIIIWLILRSIGWLAGSSMRVQKDCMMYANTLTKQEQLAVLW